MDNAYYHWYKGHGICACCAKKDATPGRVFCDDCLEKQRIRKRKEKEKLSPEELLTFKKHKRETGMNLRRKRAETGRCIDCGKTPLYNGTKHCMECLLKHRRRNREIAPMVNKNRIKGVECLWCGKPVVPGKCYCPKCLAKKRELALYASTFASEHNKKVKMQINAEVLECKRKR